MTITDYNVSSSTFDKIAAWKNTLKDVVTSCNQTASLEHMIPQLEEFIDVARSKLLHQTFRRGAFKCSVIDVPHYV